MPAAAAQTGWLLLELLLLMLLVSGALALAVRRAGLGRLQRWLGGGPTAGAGKGLALGFLLPFCTYSAVPVLVAMIDARVRDATVTAFLLSAPLLDPVVVAVLWLLFGLPVTLAYAGVAAAVVLALALIGERVGVSRWMRARGPTTAEPATVGATGVAAEPDAAPACEADPTGPDPFADEADWRGWRDERRRAWRYALGLTRRLALPMLIAVLAAVAVTGLVPSTWLVTLAGEGRPWAVPAAAVLGAPFYVSTEAFLPVAAALHAQGVGLGATLALVISAAGVNVPEMALLSTLLRRGLLAAYLVATVGAAIAVGVVVPLLV